MYVILWSVKLVLYMEGISEDSDTSLGQRSGNDEEWIIIYSELKQLKLM